MQSEVTPNPAPDAEDPERTTPEALPREQFVQGSATGAPTEAETPAPERAVPASLGKTRRRKAGSAWTSLLTSVQSLAVTVVIAVFVITFILQAFQIPSESMESTLMVGDYLLVDKVHYGNGGVWSHIEPYSEIKRGDIIVFRYPVNPQQHFVKRVVAVPGDRVRMHHKRVLVNGMQVTERYAMYRSGIRDAYRDDFPNPDYLNANVESRWWVQMRKLMRDGELTVPEGAYFVLGDNRDESLDSRYWGFVPRENIIGRPLLIYFSMSRPIRMAPALDSFTDRVHQATYNVAYMFDRIRWNRCLRLIK